jgi:integrase
VLRVSPYLQLLKDDENVRRWYENLAKGSAITAGVYRRRLGFFCKHYSLAPKALAALPPREIEDKLQDFLTNMDEKEGRTGSYIESYKKAVRSWCEWNDIHLQRKIRIRDAGRYPRVENEAVPTQEELRKVLYSDKTSLRTRACIALIAFSGLRFQSQGTFSGRDGTLVGDFPELEIKDGGGRAEFAKRPAQVTVRANLNKARHKYISFLNEEGCKIIEDLLNRRAANGEKIVKETPIVAVTEFYDTRGRKGKGSGKSSTRHLWSNKISDAIRESVRANGFDWRPYVFRSYFDSALMLAESKGKVSHAYQQFFMGHRGDIEHTYTVGKGRLSTEVVEDMRSAYSRCDQFLSTQKNQGSGGESMKDQLKKELLLVSGFKQEEVDKLDLSSMEDEEFRKLARERLLGAMANNGNRQKVVPVGEVRDLIPQGWEYVAQLPTGEAIVRLPS